MEEPVNEWWYYDDVIAKVNDARWQETMKKKDAGKPVKNRKPVEPRETKPDDKQSEKDL